MWGIGLGVLAFLLWGGMVLLFVQRAGGPATTMGLLDWLVALSAALLALAFYLWLGVVVEAALRRRV